MSVLRQIKCFRLVKLSVNYLTEKNPNFDYFPLFAASIVPVYNVPGIAYEDPENKEVPVLSLSRETLADIYRGHIYMWDDDRIAFDNPNVRFFFSVAF